MKNVSTSNLKKKIPEFYFQTPIQVLSVDTREKLKYLDCKFFVPNNLIKIRDYRGLAKLNGYITMELQELHTSPTFLILDRMEAGKKSIGDLILFIMQLKRSDIIANIKESCQNDVISYLNKSDKSQIINYEAMSALATNAEIDEANKTLGKLFTTDIIETTNKKIDIYDVFISFDSESVTDIEVMWDLSSRLESEGLTVAKGSFSFFQGCCLIEAFANAIYKRSRKVILLISQSYINSESCLMQHKFSSDLDQDCWMNKLIPFYIEVVEKPKCITDLICFRNFDAVFRERFFNNFIYSIKQFSKNPNGKF